MVFIRFVCWVCFGLVISCSASDELGSQAIVPDASFDGRGSSHADAIVRRELEASTEHLDASLAVSDAAQALDGAMSAAPPELEWVVRDNTAASTRTFYGDREGKWVFSVTFEALRAGEKRIIDGLVSVEQFEHRSADPLMMVAVSVRCRDSNGDSGEQDGIGMTQNVVRPHALTLRPRFVLSTDRAGRYTCFLSAQGGRPRPTGSFDVTKFSIQTNSFLRVSNVQHEEAAQSYAPKKASRVLDDGDAFDAVPLMWTAPEGVDAFRAFASVKLTTCTSIGGSDDPYDDLPELCGLPEHELDRDSQGTLVNALFFIGQYDKSGGYCRETRVPEEPAVLIDKDSHHEMVFFDIAKVPVDNAPNCTRNFRIKSYIKQRSGPSVIVHRQGTLSAVVPRP